MKEWLVVVKCGKIVVLLGDLEDEDDIFVIEVDGDLVGDLVVDLVGDLVVDLDGGWVVDFEGDFDGESVVVVDDFGAVDVDVDECDFGIGECVVG